VREREGKKERKKERERQTGILAVIKYIVYMAVI
jgi:hypothetical protein